MAQRGKWRDRQGCPDEVAAIFLLRDDGAALMQHRDDKPGLRLAGMWVPPGGHCDPGETILTCARRELHEETAYRCGELNWLTTLLDDYSKEWEPYPLTIFWAPFDGTQTLQCHEGQALEFIERRQASSYPIPRFLLPIWDRVLAARATQALRDAG